MQWKRDFYKAYEQNRFDKAENIYLSRLSYDCDTPDVHAAFRQHRRDDLLVKLLTSTLFAAALLLFWLLA